MSKHLRSPSQTEKVYRCIEQYIGVNVRGVLVFYLNDIDFLRCIKSNINLSLESFENINVLKEFYIEFCKRIPGLYKWREKTVFIKEKEKGDLSLLLSELLHAKSITQGHKEIEDWIKEGLPHYLSRILCEKCKIPYSESGHQQFFPIWEKIHQKYNLSVLSTIIYAKDIRITKSILKNILNYQKDDILEISFQKTKELMGF